MRLTFTVLVIFLLCFKMTDAQEGVKILEKSMEIEFSIVRGELKTMVTEVIKKEVLDITKAKEYELKHSIFQDEEFESKPTFNAYTEVMKDGKLKKIRATSITEEDYASRGIFYSGTKRFIVNFPSLETGAIFYCETKQVFKEPHLIPGFYFDDYLKCDKASLKIITEKGIEVGTLDFLYDYQDKMEYSEVEYNDIKTSLWVGRNIEARNYDRNSGGMSCSSPHIVVHIKSYSLEGEQKRVLSDVNDLFKWYTSLVADYELAGDHLWITDSLKANSAQDIELAENIFNWVQHNVKYIAYEEGLGGFMPRNPNAVIRNRYGDCKDMALLTKTMMSACGLECHVAWVGTRSKCYTYESCPTPVTDNHMIAAFPMGEEYIFLDPTSSYSEFGVPSSFIQGKEAMIRKNATSFEVVEIKEMDGYKNVTYDSLHLVIQGNQVYGKGYNSLSGYDKIDYEYALDFNDNDAEGLFAAYHQLGNESFGIADLEQRNTDSNKGKIESHFEFTVQNWVQSFGESVYVSPFLRRDFLPKVKGRRLGLNIEHKYTVSGSVFLEIPEGYSVIGLLKNESLEENGFVLSIDSEEKEGILCVKYTFECNRLRIEPEEFEEVQATFKKIRKKLKQQIELRNEI